MCSVMYSSSFLNTLIFRNSWLHYANRSLGKIEVSWHADGGPAWEHKGCDRHSKGIAIDTKSVLEANSGTLRFIFAQYCSCWGSRGHVIHKLQVSFKAAAERNLGSRYLLPHYVEHIFCVWHYCQRDKYSCSSQTIVQWNGSNLKGSVSSSLRKHWGLWTSRLLERYHENKLKSDQAK